MVTEGSSFYQAAFKKMNCKSYPWCWLGGFGLKLLFLWSWAMEGLAFGFELLDGPMWGTGAAVKLSSLRPSRTLGSRV